MANLLDIGRVALLAILLLVLAALAPLIGLIFGGFCGLALAYAVVAGGIELFFEWRRDRAFTRAAERDPA